MTLPYTYVNGDSVDATPQNSNEQYLDGRTSNIMGSQINANAGIPATAVSPTLAGNANLREDLLDLESSVTGITGAANGSHSIWNYALPVEGATALSASDGGGLLVDVAAGGQIKIGGHDLVAKATVDLGVGGAGGAALTANSCYALRLKLATPAAAQFTESGQDSTVYSWDIDLVNAGEWENAAVTGVTSGKQFSIGAGADLMGATLKFITSGGQCVVPFANAGTVYLNSNLSATPVVGERVLIRYDQQSRREDPGSNGGASTPTNALVGIIVTGATTLTFHHLLNIGGIYAYHTKAAPRRNVVEYDWSSTFNNATAGNTVAVAPPWAGARLRKINGFMALYNSSTAPTKVILAPLSHSWAYDDLGTGVFINHGLAVSYDGANIVTAMVDNGLDMTSFTTTGAPVGATFYRVKFVLEWE